MWNHSMEATICKLGREFSPGTKLSSTLILVFLASRLWQIYFCCFIHTVCEISRLLYASTISLPSVHWKDWCWNLNSSTLATSCEELTHWKRPWCWEGLSAGGEGDDRGWDSWMASPTQWARVWVNSGSWWWSGRPGVLRFMRSQRVRHDWATELKLYWHQGFPGSSWRICLQCRKPHFNSWVGKIPWRRDRLTTSVLMGFPGGSDGKESVWIVGGLCLIPGLERSRRRRPGNPLQYCCLENPQEQRSLAGYSPWGRKESDTTEPLRTHAMENYTAYKKSKINTWLFLCTYPFSE